MKKSPQRLLIVDDDLRLRSLLSRYLAEQGFVIDAVENSDQMDSRLKRAAYALIVLDLMLPGEDGLAICRRLRAAANTIPIIMLTAKSDEIDRILGLEMGADDYLPKPFNPRELLARIHAVLRRNPASLPGAPSTDDEVIEFGAYRLNLSTRLLTKHGLLLTLTTGEFAILKALATHARKPLSRDQLAELARGREHDAFDRSIDVQISRLRKLVEDEPGNPRHIQTVWGIGYVFVPNGNRS